VSTGPAEPRTICLLGGDGRMGRMFRRLFEADGYTVTVGDRAPPAAHEALIRAADVVILTVPIRETVPLARAIAAYLKPRQLLSDFTSIKAEPVAAMLETPAQVIGCHPIFGPMADPTGQNVVLCPARPGPWLPWYRAFFERHGMQVAEMSPAEHDQAMAFIQGLTHFINITFAKTLASADTNLEHLLQVCSPVYRIFFAMLCRILSGDEKLYGQIQMSNPANVPVVAAFLENGESLLELVRGGDLEAFYREFQAVADYLGSYKEVARDESNYLVERIREYLAERSG